MIFYNTKIVIQETSSTFKVLKFLESSTMFLNELILDFSGEFISFQKILKWEKLLFSKFLHYSRKIWSTK